MNEKILKVIKRLEQDPKQGVSYDDSKGRHGWRNPIRNDTGLVIYNLVKARQPKRVLEIGTAYGLSALYIAAAMGKDGYLDTIEFDPETAKTAQANLDEAGVNATVFTGDAIDTIPKLEGGYEVVFLDAQKNQYLKYVSNLLLHDKIVKPCLILADNVMDRAEEVQDFLQWFENYDVVVIPVGQAEGMPTAGLSIAVL